MKLKNSTYNAILIAILLLVFLVVASGGFLLTVGVRYAHFEKVYLFFKVGSVVTILIIFSLIFVKEK
jgi:membrane protein implicated in regulation of membrane protease activity